VRFESKHDAVVVETVVAAADVAVVVAAVVGRAVAGFVDVD
jgi:hypothetical protein